MSCCCYSSLTKNAAKASPTAPFRRYRRSSLCRAPRKRTFIANMQKVVIDAELPSGLAGESFFGASTLCPITAPAPCCGWPQDATFSPMMIMSTAFGGNNNGRGNGRGGNDLLYSGDDDTGASEQLAVLPLALAVALCVVLYPTLEGMAAPTMEGPKVQLVAAPAYVTSAADEEIEEAMHSAISALLGKSYQSRTCTEEASEGKLVLQLA